MSTWTSDSGIRACCAPCWAPGSTCSSHGRGRAVSGTSSAHRRAVAAIGLIFIEPLFVLAGFPVWIKDSVLWWSGQAIMSSRPRPGYPSASLGFAVCGVYGVLALALAGFMITRRDA